MENFKEKLDSYFEASRRGRAVWKEIEKKYHVLEEDSLVLFPDNDEKLNYAALRNLGGYLKKKYISRVLLIFSDRNIIYGSKYQVINIKEDMMRDLLRYYRLTQFREKIVVISMKEPFGNDGIIGEKGITLDDYVMNALYV